MVDLGRADGLGFVEAYVDSEPNCLGAGFRQALYAHTEGNPLFTVELLRSFERQGALVRDAAGRWIEAHELNWDQSPARVEAIIAGHLAGLPDEDRTLLQAASVQGEQFVAEVVAQVLGWDEAAVVQRLSGPLRTRHRLVEAVSLERLASTGQRPSASSGPGPGAERSGQRLTHYRFRHALLHRGAYGDIHAVERGRLHEVTAGILEELYTAQGEKPLGLAPKLARHYEAAGMPLQAARALHDAGRGAMRVAAYRQALDNFDHGLSLLAGVPPSPERAEIARLLDLAKLGPQRNLEGYTSASLVRAYAQASQAWAGQAEARPALTILFGQTERLFATAQYRQGLEKAEQLREQATQWGDETFVALAHLVSGTLYHGLGDLQQAQGHLSWVLDWLTPEGAAGVRAAVGLDVEAIAMAFSALDEWFLGYPDTALARSRRGIAGASQRGDAHAQAQALAMGCTLLFLVRDEVALAERVEQCYSLCQQHGFQMWQAYAAVLRGRVAGDVEQIQSTLATWQQVGPTLGTDSLLLVLADTCLQVAGPRLPTPDAAAGARRAGLLATGLEAVEAMIGPGKVRYGCGYPAELYRVRGELLLAREGLAASEPALECFQTALRLAGEHGLRCPELRAAVSLARLWQAQGRREQARELLGGIYAWFTEGFDTPDLVEAKALLAELEIA